MKCPAPCGLITIKLNEVLPLLIVKIRLIPFDPAAQDVVLRGLPI
jgi:hypothetical protein